MSKFYYLSSKSWVELTGIVYPINHTFGIDGGTDTVQLTLVETQKLEFPVDTIIKCVNNDDIRYYTVYDSDYNDISITERLHVLVLKEPFEIARGYKLQACTFGEHLYTLYNIVQRCFKLAKFDGLTKNIDNIDFIPHKLSFNSTSLYLALHEIGRMIDSVPLFDFDETELKWVLQYQSLASSSDILHGEQSLNILSKKSERGEGVAKKVYFEGSNIKVGHAQSIETKPQPTDGSSTTTSTNFGIILNNNINELNNIIIKPYYTTPQDIVLPDGETISVPFGWVNYWNIYNGATITYSTGGADTSKTFYIITKNKYDQLTISEKENQEIIYIYYENNIIYLNELNKLAQLTSEIPTIYGIDPITGEVELIHKNPDILLWTRDYIVTASFIITSNIPMFIHNDSNYDDTVFYNPTSTIIDPNMATKVLQSYIDNMKGGEAVRTAVYTDWSNIAKEGQWLTSKGKVYLVNSLTIVEHINYFDVTYNLVDDHAHRREYMEADTTVRTFSIPNEDWIETNYLDETIVNVSINDEITNETQSEVTDKFNNDYEYKFLFPTTQPLINLQWKSNFNNNSETYVDRPVVFTASNNIFFNIKAYSNIIWRLDTDNSGNVLPLSYGNGLINNAEFQLIDSKNNWFYKLMYTGSNLIPVKDLYESLNITLQFNYNGSKSTKVYDGLLRLMRNGISGNPKVRYYDLPINNYDNLPNPALELEVSNLIWAHTSTNVKLELQTKLAEGTKLEYRAIAIYYGNTPLLARTMATTQTKLTSVDIYYTFEDGYPVQTGVRPYDNIKERSK